jgi:aldo/keto reductase family protein
MQKSPVMLPIPGISSLAHLEENMAAEKLQLSADQWKKIEEKRRRLTQTPYKQPQFIARFARRNSGDGLPSGRFSFYLSIQRREGTPSPTAIKTLVRS